MITTEQEEKALDGVFHDKRSLRLTLEALDEVLCSFRIRDERRRQKILNFIRENVSVEDLPEVDVKPQF
ncbi:MAG: hypothetical protein AAB340_02520 [Patescibacteria group bacterium]